MAVSLFFSKITIGFNLIQEWMFQVKRKGFSWENIIMQETIHTSVMCRWRKPLDAVIAFMIFFISLYE